MVRKTRIAAIAAASLAMVAGASPAMAGTGCNGVVNIFVWGCAPWDTNNGAKFPYYKKHAVTVTGKLLDQQGNKVLVDANGNKFPLISQDGNGIVAQGGGNFKGQGWAQ